MIALTLFGIAAASGLADFDLTTSPMAGRFARPAPITAPLQQRSIYLPPKLEEAGETSDDDGIRVKLRWRKVKLYVPFGPN